MSLGDLENAFHMLRKFPGLSNNCFVMPPVEARAIGICELNGKPIDPKYLI